MLEKHLCNALVLALALAKFTALPNSSCPDVFLPLLALRKYTAILVTYKQQWPYIKNITEMLKIRPIDIFNDFYIHYHYSKKGFSPVSEIDRSKE